MVQLLNNAHQKLQDTREAAMETARILHLGYIERH